MRLRLTIVCMALALGLFAGSAFAQGFNVLTSSKRGTVVYGGNNQLMPTLNFSYATSGDRNITFDDAGEIIISYSGLRITNEEGDGDAGTELSAGLFCGTPTSPALATTTLCQGGDEPSAVIKNDKDGKGTVEVSVPNNFMMSFQVSMIRTDVSSLDVDDDISVVITSSEEPGLIPLGGATTTGSISGVLATVENGLAVTAVKDTGLSCGDSTVTPSITIAEGFDGAWDDNLGQANTGAPRPWIKVAVKNLPADDKITWKEMYTAVVKLDTDDNALTAPIDVIVGTLTPVTVSDVTKEDGSVIVFSYAIPDMPNAMGYTKARSFMITPEEIKIANSASLDIHTILVPHAMKDSNGKKLVTDLMNVLSFDAPAVYPAEGNGMNWAVVSDCVTYLLYPFVTCGATDGWTTGISVSNTSRDENIFGAFDDTEDQSGPVTFYGFSKRTESGMMPDVIKMTVSEDLAAGDTVSFSCHTGPTMGMEGYAIIKANFQHARGMGFVMGDFEGGASIDVSHGYKAEVIDDPNKRTDQLPTTP